jgi:hypothetical protein
MECYYNKHKHLLVSSVFVIVSMKFHPRQIILLVSSRYQTGFGGLDNLKDKHKNIGSANQFNLIFILFSPGCPWRKVSR